MLKRIFDIVFCLIISPFILPIYLIIAVSIKIASPGPIHYLGLRSGKSETTFRIFKFRTMVVNAERIGGGTTALNDFRIYPFGTFLRKFKLDEIPQIFNVIRGEMSIVGPRPELPQYTRLYNEEEKKILAVRPGITDYSSIKFSSLDQIVGSANADDEFERRVLPEKNKLRLKYVNEHTLLIDLYIIVGTITCIIRKALKN